VCTAFRTPIGIQSVGAAGSIEPELALYKVLTFRSLSDLAL
jgi:hypothetical protein